MNSSNISKESLYNIKKHEEFVETLKENLAKDLEKKEELKNETKKM
jgi:hypothetical protein